MEKEPASLPPRMPEAPASSPYSAPARPPMLPQAQTGGAHADGLSQDDRTMGMLVHLLGLLAGFLGVLILWMVKKDQSKYVDFHGREALNFMITMMIYSIGLAAIGAVLAFFTMGIGFLLVVPVLFVIGIGQIVCEIKACIAANRGEWHRYPMSLRLIPDAG